jgi:hypothetical protein
MSYRAVDRKILMAKIMRREGAKTPYRIKDYEGFRYAQSLKPTM